MACYTRQRMSASDSPSACSRHLHPRAHDGILLFNRSEFFAAHEALEDAWREEESEIRDLYRGILQIAVTYFHITRGNFAGALKVFKRSQKWLGKWPSICQGVNVTQLSRDANMAIIELQKLGKENISSFDTSLLLPIQFNHNKSGENFVCDRCGHEMYERNCKITCPNCGNRFDCSDLNIYFD